MNITTENNEPVTFNHLKIPPSIDGLLNKLKYDEVFTVVQRLNPNVAEDTLLHRDMWNTLTVALIRNIHACIPHNKHQLGNLKKTLVKEEFNIIHNWAGQHSAIVPLAALQSMAYVYLRYLLQDLSHGISLSSLSLSTTFTEVFEMNFHDIQSHFNKRQKEAVYYLAGWLIKALVKNAKHRNEDGKLKEFMDRLAANSTSEKGAEQIANLPTQKVEYVELYGGMTYCNSPFFEITMRLELCFMKTLNAEFVTLYGADLIVQIYSTLSVEPLLKKAITVLLNMDLDVEIAEVGIMTKFICRAYCRMRGDDFVKKLMSEKVSNLAQPIRKKLAVVSSESAKKVKLETSSTNLQDKDSNIATEEAVKMSSEWRMKQLTEVVADYCSTMEKKDEEYIEFEEDNRIQEEILLGDTNYD